jgi:RNA polymerase sigma factor for flagellar operon FliA
LICANLALVRHLAGRAYQACRGQGLLGLEELVSAGMLGLIQAAESFQEEREASFGTFASAVIRGAIQDEIRRHDTVSRTTRRLSRRIREARRVLEQRLGRLSTVHEVAEEVGLEPERVRLVDEEISSAAPLSFEEMLESAGLGGRAQVAPALPPACDGNDDVELTLARRWIEQRLERLSGQERTVIQLYFYEEQSMEEIGRAMGLTNGRISQIRSQALNKLRGTEGARKRRGRPPGRRADRAGTHTGTPAAKEERRGQRVRPTGRPAGVSPLRAGTKRPAAAEQDARDVRDVRAAREQKVA